MDEMEGYGWLRLHAIQRGYAVLQDSIRRFEYFGPEGAELSCTRHHSEGLNMLWHMDSSEKLKSQGAAASCFIDGFSHYVVWMEAYRTNNDTKVIRLQHSLQGEPVAANSKKKVLHCKNTTN